MINRTRRAGLLKDKESARAPLRRNIRITVTRALRQDIRKDKTGKSR